MEFLVESDLDRLQAKSTLEASVNLLLADWFCPDSNDLISYMDSRATLRILEC